MITIQLTRGQNTEGVFLYLPATREKIGEAYALLDAVNDDPSTTRVLKITSGLDNLSRYLEHTDVLDPEQFEQLQEIAKQTDHLTAQQAKILSGALDAESINSPEDILNIVNRMDDYTIIPKVTNDHELGAYLVKTGWMTFPEHLRRHINYASIGAEYHANHGGAYTADGYVLRKSAIEPLLEQNRAQVFRVSLQTGLGRRNGYEPNQFVLPASIERMEHAKKALSIEDLAEAAIVQTDCLIPHLCGLIPLDDVDVARLDELAENIESIIREDNALITYCAALCAERPQTFEDALAISIDLDDYEMVTEDMDEYGKEVLRRIGADDELINTIDGYMDFAGLGEASMLEEGVRRTAYGLVRRLSSLFPEPAQGQQML